MKYPGGIFMNVSMTASAMAKQYIYNWNMKLNKNNSLFTNGSTPLSGHINPYEDPWMDITNRSSSEWQRMIPVDEDVANQVRNMVKEDFVKRYGMTDGSPEHIDDRANLIKNYTKTLPGEQRLAATWTLGQVVSEEAARLKSIILKHDPSWTYGKPFDTSILDEDPSNHLDIYV